MASNKALVTKEVVDKALKKYEEVQEASYLVLDGLNLNIIRTGWWIFKKEKGLVDVAMEHMKTSFYFYLSHALRDAAKKYNIVISDTDFECIRLADVYNSEYRELRSLANAGVEFMLDSRLTRFINVFGGSEE